MWAWGLWVCSKAWGVQGQRNKGVPGRNVREDVGNTTTVTIFASTSATAAVIFTVTFAATIFLCHVTVTVTAAACTVITVTVIRRYLEACHRGNTAPQSLAVTLGNATLCNTHKNTATPLQSYEFPALETQKHKNTK